MDQPHRGCSSRPMPSGFADHFVRQKRVRRMNSAEARVPQQTLVSRGAKDAVAACNVEAAIDDAPGRLDGPILDREDLRWPFGAIIHAVRPIFRDSIEMRPEGLEIDDHLRDCMLDLRVVRHRSRERE